jgi:putative spermidine/putrescine transport system permease protein
MAGGGADAARALARDRRARVLQALGLTAPLLVFLAFTFLIPIGALLMRAVENPEVARALPATVAVLDAWDSESAPPDGVYRALADDLLAMAEPADAGGLARRLNSELPGARSLVMGAFRQRESFATLDAPAAKAAFLALDARWQQPELWRVIARNGSRWTPDYLLASVDRRRDAAGAVVAVPEEQAVFVRILLRTLGIGATVTLVCLVLAYPLAWWLSTLPVRKANRLLILVLVPFWTSVLVRVAAWIVLLQSEGLVNRALAGLGWIDRPLELLFNRTGVIIAMVHILLPFMILPLYSVMKGIPRDYQRAAVSLGSHPLGAFVRVFVPQTLPGVTAGVLLVFILAIGYYVTPALLGGPADQMLSSSVAQYANVELNWGMACALGAVLLTATLVLYGVYRRFATGEGLTA